MFQTRSNATPIPQGHRESVWSAAVGCRHVPLAEPDTEAIRERAADAGDVPQEGQTCGSLACRSDVVGSGRSSGGTAAVAWLLRVRSPGRRSTLRRPTTRQTRRCWTDGPGMRPGSSPELGSASRWLRTPFRWRTGGFRDRPGHSTGTKNGQRGVGRFSLATRLAVNQDQRW